jgi:hypothetical protein
MLTTVMDFCFKKKMFIFPQVLLCNNPTLGDKILNPTWKAHSGTNKGEIESRLSQTFICEAGYFTCLCVFRLCSAIFKTKNLEDLRTQNMLSNSSMR